MAQVQVYNQEGKKTSKLELADSVFAIEPNESAMHLAVVSYLANQRQGTQSTLVLRSAAAVQSPGDRKAPVVPVRVLPEARSGPTAVLLSARSPEHTASASTRRCADWL